MKLALHSGIGITPGVKILSDALPYSIRHVMSLVMATGMPTSSLASHPQLLHTARLVWQHVTLMWQAHRLHHHPALTPALPPSHCSLQCLASTMTTFVPPRMQSLYRPSKRPSLSLTMSLTNKGLLNPAGENNCFLNSAVQVGSN